MTTRSIALITGGSRGLGRSAALALAARGTDVVLTYRSNQAEAQATVAAIEALGRRAAALPLDLADPAGIPAFVVIDFEYEPFYNTTEDTPDKCSVQSLEAVGRTLLRYLYLP